MNYQGDRTLALQQTQCTWADAKNGSAEFTVTNGKVTAIALRPGFDIKKQRATLSGPATAFKTSKGIGIGSTLKALRKAYPKAMDGAANTFVIFSGKISTSFDFDHGRISVIGINAPPV